MFPRFLAISTLSIALLLPSLTLGYWPPKQQSGRSEKYVDQALEDAKAACNCPRLGWQDYEKSKELHVCSRDMERGSCENSGDGPMYKCTEGNPPVKVEDCGDCGMDMGDTPDAGPTIKCGGNSYPSLRKGA